MSVEKSCGEKKVLFIHADVSNHELMTAAFEETLNFMNDIDIIINNAGILDERRWEKEIAVNIVSNKEIVLLSICVCVFF